MKTLVLYFCDNGPATDSLSLSFLIVKQKHYVITRMFLETHILHH